MRSVPRPTNDAGETFRLCISRVHSVELLNRLTAVEPEVVKAAAEFETAMEAGTAYLMPEQGAVGGRVTVKEMRAVYEGRMANQKGPGRSVYDQIIALAPRGTCPLCVHRPANTLDHYLPKVYYPALSVAPLNLVPVCGDCNHLMLDAVARTPEEQKLHPYFEDLSAAGWLGAAIVEEHPAAIRFFVSPPEGWDDVLIARVRRHFIKLKLGPLYSIQAADELSGLRHHLGRLFDRGGAEAVREHLEERAESWEEAHRGTWHAPAYRAMASDDWFCAGGFC